MIKQTLLVAITVFAVTLLSQNVNAGGCCYKKFAAIPGTVGAQPAKITVSFIDPANPYTDASMTTMSSLANERVTIKIINPKAGQSCVMLTPTTNDQGKIAAECTSKTIDSIKVYFEAPDIDPQYQEMFSSVSQVITFNGLATSQPSPTTVTQPQHTPQPTSTPQASPHSVVTTTPNPELQKRIDELEQKVAKQEKEVTGLRAIVDRIMSFFERLF